MAKRCCGREAAGTGGWLVGAPLALGRARLLPGVLGPAALFPAALRPEAALSGERSRGLYCSGYFGPVPAAGLRL